MSRRCRRSFVRGAHCFRVEEELGARLDREASSQSPEWESPPLRELLLLVLVLPLLLLKLLQLLWLPLLLFKLLQLPWLPLLLFTLLQLLWLPLLLSLLR